MINDFWNGVRVFVTGASGFLGSHLVRRLLVEQSEVFVLLRPDSDALRLSSLRSQLAILLGDLRDFESVQRAVRQCQPKVVFHLAAMGVNPSLSNSTAVVETNVLGTLNLLEALHDQPVYRFVYTGSCFEYGNGSGLREEDTLAPTGVYGASKAAGWLLAETYSRTYGIPIVSIRPFTAYGPFERKDRLVPNTIIHALKGQDLPTTAGEQERDFVYVEDMISGFLLAVTSTDALGKTINLCSGLGVPVREMIKKILSLMGHPIKPLFGILPYREGELWRNSGDPTRAREILGWTAETSLESGLRKTIAWHQDNLELAMQLWR